MSKNITQSRKTRSDKFPLTLHKTGQYCKKIKGKKNYFGTNKKSAYQKYLEQVPSLHLNQSPHNASESDIGLPLTAATASAAGYVIQSWA